MKAVEGSGLGGALLRPGEQNRVKLLKVLAFISTTFLDK